MWPYATVCAGGIGFGEGNGTLGTRETREMRERRNFIYFTITHGVFISGFCLLFTESSFHNEGMRVDEMNEDLLSSNGMVQRRAAS